MDLQFFGQFLIEEGEIDEFDLEDALAEIDGLNLQIGALAVRAGHMTEESVAWVNETQRRRDLPFGELATEQGLLSRAQVDELLAHQAEQHVFLGETLVRRGFIDSRTLESALQRFKAEQALAAEVIHGLPTPIQEEPFFESVMDLMVNLSKRLAGLKVKLAPLREWQGQNPYPIAMGVEADIGHPVNLGLAASQELARALAAGMRGAAIREIDKRSARNAVAELLGLMAANAKAGLGREDQYDIIGSVEPGTLPQTGYATHVISTHGAGVLVMEPG